MATDQIFESKFKKLKYKFLIEISPAQGGDCDE